MKTYTLTDEAIERIASLLREHHNNRKRSVELPEAVYLVYGYDTGKHVYIDHFALVRNAHEDPQNYFGVEVEDAKRVTTSVLAVRPNLTLVGCFHSHEAPGSTGPSWTDIDTARPGMIHAVICSFKKIISFYDEHGFIIQFKLVRDRLMTTRREVVTNETRIAQYSYASAEQ